MKLDKLFQTLVDYAPVMIWISGTDKLCFYFNKPWLNFTGRALEQESGNGWAEGVHPEDFDRCLEIYVSHFDQRAPFQMEYRLKRHDGEWRWILDTGTAYYDENHEFQGYIGSCIDITDMHNANQDLMIAAKAFETSEGIIVTDAEAKVLRVNSAFTKITGYSEQEVLGNTPALLKSDRQSDAFYKTMWEALMGQGVWSGEIWNKRKDGRHYPEWLTISAVLDSATDKVSHYVGVFEDLSAKHDADEKLQRLAYYDTLTDLPNRRLFAQHVEQAVHAAKRSKTYGAVVLIDLDNFKQVNDAKGHDYGDFLLKEMANRLSSCIRAGDVVGRLGGDEFGLLLENLHASEDFAGQLAQQVAKKIIEVLSAPFTLHEIQGEITPSIGIALFSDDADSSSQLLRYADSAMYAAKNAGRNTFCFFNPSLQTRLEHRFKLENELRLSTQKSEFKVLYQPQIANGKVSGAEALVRWVHPDLGIVPPSDFIPLAEETGLIVPIGTVVLRHACEQLQKWSLDPQTQDWSLAVNISARQLFRPDFTLTVKTIIEDSRIKPEKLKLEITESTMMQEIESASVRLAELSSLGVRISIDDFGTGYSSLAYLVRLPVNQIKIDKSFTDKLLTDSNSATVTKTIIGMAHELDMEVIAEGVETQAQVDFLTAHGCINFQGYLYGKPMEPENLLAL